MLQEVKDYFKCSYANKWTTVGYAALFGGFYLLSIESNNDLLFAAKLGALAGEFHVY